MLDGFFGYNQVLVNKEDQHKITFTTPWGTYKFLRMPFGLLNAGATFQRAMDFAFKELIGKVIEIYQDDLISETHKETLHMKMIVESDLLLVASYLTLHYTASPYLHY